MGLVQQYLEEGKSLEKLGHIPQAIDKYSLALNRKPSCFPALKRLATLYEEIEEFHKAAEYLRQLVQLKPDNIQYTMRLGAAIAQTENTQAAVNFYRKALYSKLLKSHPDFVNQYWDETKFQNPNFLIIGVMKCGTTSLYHYMSQHPQILPAINKELHFFNKWLKIKSNQSRIESGDFYLEPQDQQLYLSQFPGIVEGSNYITGEATPSYIRTKNAEKLIYNSCPDVKLIVILREPVERAISDYQMKIRINLKKNKEFSHKFEEVVQKELKAFEKENYNFAKVVEDRDFGVLTKGLYVYHLERWMQLFPKEQFLILRTEDLSQNPSEVMGQVFQFLGLPDCKEIQYPIRNSGKYSADIDPALLTRLQEFYKPHNQKLEELLGRKFNWS